MMISKINKKYAEIVKEAERERDISIELFNIIGAKDVLVPSTDFISMYATIDQAMEIVCNLYKSNRIGKFYKEGSEISTAYEGGTEIVPCTIDVNQHSDITVKLPINLTTKPYRFTLWLKITDAVSKVEIETITSKSKKIADSRLLTSVESSVMKYGTATPNLYQYTMWWNKTDEEDKQVILAVIENI